MRRIFGVRKAQAPAPSLGDASQRLDERTTALDDKIRKLEVELGGYKEKLKKARGAAAQTLKRRAMGVLKRKRMYEQQRDQLAGQAFNVEQTSFAIESVKDTLETVQAMKTASKTLKKEVKKVDLSQIEDLQDDLADMMEVRGRCPSPSPASRRSRVSYSSDSPMAWGSRLITHLIPAQDMNDVQDVMGQSYGIGDDIDDADLDAELDALGDDFDLAADEDTTPAYLQPADPALMPDQPTDAPAQPDADVVDEFGLPVAAAT